MILWMSFNNNSELNEQHDFKMTDFIKNSFQAMRVGGKNQYYTQLLYVYIHLL